MFALPAWNSCDHCPVDRADRPAVIYKYAYAWPSRRLPVVGSPGPLGVSARIGINTRRTNEDPPKAKKRGRRDRGRDRDRGRQRQRQRQRRTGKRKMFLWAGDGYGNYSKIPSLTNLFCLAHKPKKKKKKKKKKA